MEKQIKQNFRAVLKSLPIRFSTILLFCVVVLCAVVAYTNGQKDPTALFQFVLGLSFWLLLLLLLVALVLMQVGVKWFVTDSGLKRVASGETQMIPWERIYHIGRTDMGYFIRWRDPKEPGISGEDLEHRGILHLSKTDADELISLWRQKTSRELQAEGRTHFRSTNRRSYSRLHLWGWAMIMGGTVLICWGAVNIARHYPSSSWPSVEGKIIAQQYRLVTPKAHQTGWGGQLSLSYEYIVAGQTNRSDQYSLWQAKYEDKEETADAFAKEHQRGASVKVYFDPKDPEQAVLLPGPDWRGDFALMGLGSCAAAFGFLMRNIFSKLLRGQRVLKQDDGQNVAS